MFHKGTAVARARSGWHEVMAQRRGSVLFTVPACVQSRLERLGPVRASLCWECVRKTAVSAVSINRYPTATESSCS
jgi:hypothetical protein